MTKMKMKIGVLTQDWKKGDGGAMTFESEVVNSLLRATKQSPFEIVSLSQSSETPYSCKHIQTTRPITNVKKPLVKRILRRFRLGRRIDTQPHQPFDDLDLIYSPSYNGATTDVPFLITCWDLQHRIHPFLPEFSSSKWTWEQRENHYQFWLKRASGIIVGTEQGKSEVVSLYGIAEQLIHVIPFFASQALKNTTPISPKWLPPDPFFLYPAQFWPHKNHITLIKALSLIHQTTDLRPYLVCTGVDKPQEQGTLSLVRKLSEEKGLSSYVLTPGFVPEGELRWLYENAIALTFASHFGPDNLPPIEAMSMGCPVIASKVNGSEEQLGEAALLVPPLSEAEFAKQMTAVVANPELRRELVERGIHRTTRLTVDEYTTNLLKIFDLHFQFQKTWK